MIFLGEKDGRQEQNASGQKSLRRNRTFWLKHDEHHPQATNSNAQGICSYMRLEKQNVNVGNVFFRQVV
jgi:hypothetical protein